MNLIITPICNYSGILIDLPIAILYFLARKITAEYDIRSSGGDTVADKSF